jgi:hypothetical protein
MVSIRVSLKATVKRSAIPTGAGPVLINNDRLSSTVLSGAGEFLSGRSVIFVVLITFASSIYIVCTAQQLGCQLQVWTAFRIFNISAI